MMWLGIGLSLLAALSYLLIGVGRLSTGGIEPPPAIVAVAALGYACGGLLIPTRQSRLWTVGAIINALVLTVFFQAYAGQPEVLLSSGGLVSKAAEIGLEVVLLWLISTDIHPRRQRIGDESGVSTSRNAQRNLSGPS
jgi:hypothetical protein